ncbi:MAG TPA: gamma-glutamyltransferase, partial [Gemmatimonadaceae bacterium]|nr:gamma-glutamyltransferase [Gemmatimonadaceae bacterium]
MSSPRIILKRQKAVGAIAILTLFALAAVPFSRDGSDPAIPKRVPASFPATWRFPSGAQATFAANAMVASDSRIASEVGAQIMKEGGNAVDAAVATGFALAVAYPEAGNLGGGGYMVIRMADGRVAALDYRETAPLAATRDMYVGADGKVTGESVIGPKASGVPGAVAG